MKVDMIKCDACGRLYGSGSPPSTERYNNQSCEANITILIPHAAADRIAKENKQSPSYARDVKGDFCSIQCLLSRIMQHFYPKDGEKYKDTNRCEEPFDTPLNKVLVTSKKKKRG